MDKRNIKIGVVAGLAILAALIYFALPRSGMDGMGGMNHGAGMNMADAATSQSTQGYQAAMDSMMKGMMAKPTGKPDFDFVQGMIPHHQGAIEMAKVVLQYGKDAEIKTLAENVVKAQEGEIAMMKEWLSKSDQAALVSAPDTVSANNMAMDAMMKDMMTPYSGNPDVDFAKSMIPHHEGAVAMAKVELKFGKDPALLQLAQDVVSAQESEIAFMRDWLKKKGM